MALMASSLVEPVDVGGTPADIVKRRGELTRGEVEKGWRGECKFDDTNRSEGLMDRRVRFKGQKERKKRKARATRTDRANLVSPPQWRRAASL